MLQHYIFALFVFEFAGYHKLSAIYIYYVFLGYAVCWFLIFSEPSSWTFCR